MESLQELFRYIHDGRTGLSRERRDVLKHYRELLELARKPAFSEGKTFDLGYCQGEGFDPDRHFAFLRSDGEKVSLVVANFGPGALIRVQIPSEAWEYLGCKATQSVYTQSIPSKGYWVGEIL